MSWEYPDYWEVGLGRKDRCPAAFWRRRCLSFSRTVNSFMGSQCLRISRTPERNTEEQGRGQTGPSLYRREGSFGSRVLSRIE
jgi:hypothetical protein